MPVSGVTATRLNDKNKNALEAIKTLGGETTELNLSSMRDGQV